MYAYPAGPPGDDDTFVAMCERFRPRLVALCCRRLRSTHDAEDAAHEVLLRAYRAMADFDASADAWPWLRTIAVRVCLDIQRRAARAPLPADEGRHVDDVHELFARRVRADIVEDALQQLPPRHRTTLLLKEYAGWSYEDIARTHGTSRSSVRSLLTRSRRRLGTHVETVARDRGQWPLPGVVPPVQRLRGYMRSWRDSIERSGHAVAAAFEMSSVTTRWMVGANATLAGMLSLSTAATAALVPFGTIGSHPTSPPVTRMAQYKEPLTVEASVAPVTASATVTATQTAATFSGIDASEPVPEQYNPLDAGGRAGIVDRERTMWIGVDQTISVPGVYEERRRTGTQVQCHADPQRTFTCETARTVFGQSPEQ